MRAGRYAVQALTAVRCTIWAGVGLAARYAAGGGERPRTQRGIQIQQSAHAAGLNIKCSLQAQLQGHSIKVVHVCVRMYALRPIGGGRHARQQSQVHARPRAVHARGGGGRQPLCPFKHLTLHPTLHPTLNILRQAARAALLSRITAPTVALSRCRLRERKVGTETARGLSCRDAWCCTGGTLCSLGLLGRANRRPVPCAAWRPLALGVRA